MASSTQANGKSGAGSTPPTTKATATTTSPSSTSPSPWSPLVRVYRGRDQVLDQFRVENVPGDGNCYVRAVAVCLGVRFDQLKHFIIRSMEKHPQMTISDLPLAQWVQYDSNMSLEQYISVARQNGFWCGGIENAVLCSLVNMIITIYSAHTFQPMAQFDLYHVHHERKCAPAEVNLLYTGAHYMALVPLD